MKKAESALSRLEESKLAEEARLASLEEALSLASSAPKASEGLAEASELELSILQAGVCWFPVLLTSSQMTLHFSDAFALEASFGSSGSKVERVSLCSLVPMGDTSPHMTLLRVLLADVAKEASPRMAACSSPAQLAAQMPLLALRLGRVLDLAREVEAASEEVGVDVSAHAAGGAAICVHFSSFRCSAKFSLAIHLLDETPESPLAYEVCALWLGEGLRRWLTCLCAHSTWLLRALTHGERGSYARQCLGWLNGISLVLAGCRPSVGASRICCGSNRDPLSCRVLLQSDLFQPGLLLRCVWHVATSAS